MFERFTKEARSLVTAAANDAEVGGAAEVDALHLLTAAVDADRGPGEALGLLGAIDVTPADIAERVDGLRRRGGVSDADRSVLHGLGIDVDTIIARVEQEHGEGALAEVAPAAESRGARRRTRWRVPFGADAKRVLAGSLQQARDVRDDRIGGEHVLSALAAVPGPAGEVLSDAGAAPERLRRALLQRRPAG